MSVEKRRSTPVLRLSRPSLWKASRNCYGTSAELTGDPDTDRPFAGEEVLSERRSRFEMYRKDGYSVARAGVSCVRGPSDSAFSTRSAFGEDKPLGHIMIPAIARLQATAFGEPLHQTRS
jgi:hypothetical protein